MLEQMISPEGTFPAIGRSIAYRFGAFQLLAQIALMNELPDEITPEQVRCALTAVLKRFTSSGNMFDENSWLRIGFLDSQPHLAEYYISTGSLYLCCAMFLPLGLPETHRFLSAADVPWSAKVMWNAEP